MIVKTAAEVPMEKTQQEVAPLRQINYTPGVLTRLTHRRKAVKVTVDLQVGQDQGRQVDRDRGHHPQNEIKIMAASIIISKIVIMMRIHHQKAMVPMMI